MRDGARKWKGPGLCQLDRSWRRVGGRVLTATGRVVAGHLAKVGMVLDCTRSSVSVFHPSSCRRRTSMSWTRPLPPHSTPGSPSRMLVRLRQAGIGSVRTLRAEELAGDVEGLAADHNDLLAVEELLGDDAGKATKEVALAVNDDLASSVLATRVSQACSPSRDPSQVSCLRGRLRGCCCCASVVVGRFSRSWRRYALESPGVG